MREDAREAGEARVTGQLYPEGWSSEGRPSPTFGEAGGNTTSDNRRFVASAPMLSACGSPEYTRGGREEARQRDGQSET